MDSKGCYALETIRTVVLIVYSCPGLGEIESGWSRSKILKLYWLSNRLDQKRKKKKKGLIISSAVKGKGDLISSCTLWKEII